MPSPLAYPSDRAASAATHHLTTVETSAKLSRAEAAELEARERVIKGGLEKFIEVAECLFAIRNARLYRETSHTFEEYCKLRWGFSRSSAYRYIHAAEVNAMFPNGDIARPTCEAHFRPLTRLPRDLAPNVWREAIQHAAGRPLTGVIVQNVVDHHLRKKSPRLDKNSKLGYWGQESLALVYSIKAAILNGKVDHILADIDNLRLRVERMISPGETKEPGQNGI